MVIPPLIIYAFIIHFCVLSSLGHVPAADDRFAVLTLYIAVRGYAIGFVCILSALRTCV